MICIVGARCGSFFYTLDLVADESGGSDHVTVSAPFSTSSASRPKLSVPVDFPHSVLTLLLNLLSYDGPQYVIGDMVANEYGCIAIAIMVIEIRTQFCPEVKHILFFVASFHDASQFLDRLA